MAKIIAPILMLLAVLFGLFGQKVSYDPKDYAEGQPASVTEGKVRVQLLRDTLVRIEAEGPKGFENRPSFTVEKRTGWDDVAFTEQQENGYKVIRTDRFTVYVPLGADSAAGCFITDSSGNELWRFETDTDTKVMLPSPSDELAAWSFTDNPRIIPSKQGYSVFASTTPYNGWDLDNKAQDVFVFLPGGDYGAFTKDFTDLTGKSEMIPLNLLGFWDSRYYEYTEETARQQIKDYTDRGYPLDVLVIDTDWRQQINNRGTGYTISRRHFPNFQRFANDVHEQGVSLVFNDHPEPTLGNRNLLDPFEVYYRNKNLTKILDKGLDVWWYDRNWWTTVNPIDENLSRYVTGMYVYEWITQQYFEQTAGDSYARRPIIMANVDGIGNGNYDYQSELAAHRYTLQWTGDIGPSASSLQNELENMVFLSANTLLPYTSSDLGGHTAEVSPEQYIRWIQYGALSPIMRVHCTKPYSRMPWLYGEQAERVTHQYVDLRYRLLPIFYELAHENYENGTPFLRRLDVDFPQYAESKRNDEYLLGDNLLVAPIAESSPICEDYTFTCDGQPGLKGEFYPNTDFSGEPEIVTHDERIDFDWVYEAPNGLSVSDYFTVRWSGKLTVGAKPICFTAYADDGVRVFLDGKKVIDGWNVFNTLLKTDWIAANTTHDIVVEYSDGNNHAHIFITAYTDGDVSRDVFLPDGEWMDIWSGQTFAGPDTITVTHPLETSPIFVRMGSVLPLADNMKNTASGDWSHLTLDVYPSASREAKTTLYEDDTKTVAYKSGEYRTTAITLSGDAQQTLTIEPAKGAFSGDRAFTKRSYTVRLHSRDGWGQLLGVTLNGKAVDFQTIAKAPEAAPLAIKGGSRVGDVYEVTFESDISDRSVIAFTFEQCKADKTNDAYDRSAASFDVTVKTLTKETGAYTVPANASDYVICAVDPGLDEARMANGTGQIGRLSVAGSKTPFDDNYTIRWGASSTNCGLVAGRAIGTSVKLNGSDTITLRLGGHKSLAQLTVRDRAGTVKTVTFGDKSGNYYREVVIRAEGDTELAIDYTLLSGKNITASAIVVTE